MVLRLKRVPYYDLNLQPSGATQQVIAAGTLTVNDVLTIGNGTNTGASAATSKPARLIC